MPAALTIGPLPKAASLRETVTQILRAAIISGEMAPGEVYSAPALGARFGVSATPVREAMVDLSREGLVQTVPNKGFRVTAVSEAELDDIAALRMLIEPPTVRQVTPRLRPEDKDMPLLPWIDPENFNPGYLMRGMHLLPKRGDKPEWQHTQDYWSEKDEFPAASLDDPLFVYE